MTSNSPNPPAPFPEREGGETSSLLPSPFRGGVGGGGVGGGVQETYFILRIRTSISLASLSRAVSFDVSVSPK